MIIIIIIRHLFNGYKLEFNESMDEWNGKKRLKIFWPNNDGTECSILKGKNVQNSIQFNSITIRFVSI